MVYDERQKKTFKVYDLSFIYKYSLIEIETLINIYTSPEGKIIRIIAPQPLSNLPLEKCILYIFYEYD